MSPTGIEFEVGYGMTLKTFAWTIHLDLQDKHRMLVLYWSQFFSTTTLKYVEE